MKRINLGFFWASAVLAAFFSALTHANERSIAVDKNGVAVRGYDPVAYFIDRKAVKGKADFAVQIEDGPIYHFASAENRTIFVSDPARYVPQFGGFCAAGAAEGIKVQVNPNSFRVIDGKLYLLSSAATEKKWSQNASNLIRKADANWTPVAPK